MKDRRRRHTAEVQLKGYFSTDCSFNIFEEIAKEAQPKAKQSVKDVEDLSLLLLLLSFFLFRPRFSYISVFDQTRFLNR